MNALTASNLKDSFLYDRKPKKILEKYWDKMNRMACGIIRSCLTQDLKYHVMTKTSARKIRELLESKYLTQSIKKQLQLKRRFYRFQLKKEIFISEHMNNYTKFLVDLVNVDEVIKDEDKALILLSFLPDDVYETFVLTLINGIP